MTSTSKPIATGQPDRLQDQSEVIAFLGSPATYGAGIDTVDRIETHGALVFLAGERAYKLKRAVKLPYMDFSTLEKRAVACRHEIDRNRPAAPDIYIGALPIVRRDDGALALGGAGAPVDWVVVMNRFDQADLFDQLAKHGQLPVSQMTPLAEQVADYHEKARTFRATDGSNDLANTISQIITSLYEASDLIGLERIQQYAGQIVTELNARSRLLRARSRFGCVRLCHGDLHLRNIVLHDNRAMLFDAIEFDDRIATIDVLYDFAFLLMDLWHRGLKTHANHCFGSYVSKAVPTSALDGLAALPLFLSTRAAIRAMVMIDQLSLAGEIDQQASIKEIEDYLSLATQFLAPSKPALHRDRWAFGHGQDVRLGSLSPQDWTRTRCTTSEERRGAKADGRCRSVGPVAARSLFKRYGRQSL